MSRKVNLTVMRGGTDTARDWLLRPERADNPPPRLCVSKLYSLPPPFMNKTINSISFGSETRLAVEGINTARIKSCTSMPLVESLKAFLRPIEQSKSPVSSCLLKENT